MIAYEHPLPSREFRHFILILLSSDLLAAILAVLRFSVMSDTIGLVLYYLCSVLTLFPQFAALGGAFFLLGRGDVRRSCLLLLAAAGGLFLSLLITGVRESLLYWDFDFVSALLTQIGAALANTILYAALHFAVLAVVYLLFFRGEPVSREQPAFFGRGTLPRAGLIAALATLIVKLFSLVPDTIDFFTVYWPNIYDNEIVMIVFDYIFLVLSLFLGYLVAGAAEIYFAACVAPDPEGDIRTPSSKHRV